ncbi:hypothetical protein B879_00014 [Cecembia lonarensis LW9]|uniref:Uncharacterized protein n=1 Tax=Cecembia lonarensis (strain CCUG 58316 / KCTC 22772 / LW9) TaxID=1225176 RepID=K1L9B2_CECL9|nr:hypothetical protein B879_00014 [Cecembia lonarensis LW9]
MYRKGNDRITRHAERSEASPQFWETLRLRRLSLPLTELHARHPDEGRVSQNMGNPP